MAKQRFSLLVKSALVGLALCIPASAAAEGIGFTGSTNFTGKGHGAGVSISLGSYSYNGFGGELNWLWGADADPNTIALTPAGFAQAFYSYCVDITQYLRDPQLVEVVSSHGFYQDPAVSQGGWKAAWLFNNYASDIRQGLVTDFNDRAAGLQVAIWEAMYDNSASLSGGNFKLATGGDVATYANNYLAALYSSQAGWGSSSAWVLKTANGQDQITVPEPATAAMLGVGLLIMATRRRSRIRA